MKRAETDWSETPYPETVMGLAEAGKDEGGDQGHPVAVLWVPDPEQRHGYREVYVYRPAKPGRPVGFRKPGAR